MEPISAAKTLSAVADAVAGAGGVVKTSLDKFDAGNKASIGPCLEPESTSCEELAERVCKPLLGEGGDPMKYLTRVAKGMGLRLSGRLMNGEEPSVAEAALAVGAYVVPMGMSEGASMAGDKIKEVVVESREVGQLATADASTQRRAVVESYVDERYKGHGNLEDFVGELKDCELHFKSLMLALVDVLDMATFGVLTPHLMTLKITPHLGHRLVVYQAEMTNSELPSGDGQNKSCIRCDQCTRFDVEIDKALFDDCNMEFNQFADQVICAGLAKRTVVYSRLKEETVRYEAGSQIENAGWHGQEKIEDKRVRIVEGQADLLSSPMTAASYMCSGGKLTYDRSLKHLIGDAETSSVVDLGKEVKTAPDSEKSNGLIEEKSTEVSTIQRNTHHLHYELFQESDHLSGRVSAVDGDGELIGSTTVETCTSETSRKYYRLLGCDVPSFGGKNIETATTTRTDISENVTDIHVDGNSRDGITMTEADSRERTIEGETVREKTYEDGWVTYLPGGQVVNLALKSGLGADVDLKDWAFACVDGVITISGVGALAKTGFAAVAGVAKVASPLASGVKAGKMALPSFAKVGSKVKGHLKPTPHPSKVAHHLPTNNGTWKGKPGDSDWVPKPDYVPNVCNPRQETMQQILRSSGIEDGCVIFRKGYPIFDKVAEIAKNRLMDYLHSAGQALGRDLRSTITLDGFSSDRSTNFSLYDKVLEKKLNLSPGTIRKALDALELTRHEATGGRIQLLPRTLHAAIPHSGGISQAKRLAM